MTLCQVLSGERQWQILKYLHIHSTVQPTWDIISPWLLLPKRILSIKKIRFALVSNHILWSYLCVCARVCVCVFIRCLWLSACFYALKNVWRYLGSLRFSCGACFRGITIYGRMIIWPLVVFAFSANWNAYPERFCKEQGDPSQRNPLTKTTSQPICMCVYLCYPFSSFPSLLYLYFSQLISISVVQAICALIMYALHLIDDSLLPVLFASLL